MNKMILLSVLLLSAAPSFATSKMKAGLWEITTEMSQDGKPAQNPMAKMQEAMAKMPPEKRKMMEEMMAKNGMNVGTKGMQICYTEDMLKDKGAMLNQDKKAKCTNKITQDTATKTIMEFTCENGTKGTGEYNFKDDENYTGDMKITSAKGNSEIKHVGHFVSKDCGNVKPLSEMAAKVEDMKKRKK